MKKAIALLLVLCLMFGIQAAAFADLDRTKGTPERAEAEAKTFAMYPIDPDGDVTLDIWVPFNSQAAKYIESFNENEALTEASKATGVKLNFIHPAIGQEGEQFNLMMAGGDLPDIVQHNNYYPGGAGAGVADGVFVELTDLIHEYSPTYSMILDNVFEFWRDATDADGRVYSYYLYKEAKAEEEGDSSVLMVREDWLREAGMDVLRTVDDYDRFFQWVLDNKEGVVPFTPPTDGLGHRLLSGFNLINGYFVEDGQVHHFMNEDRLKDYLTMMANWYAKGYISPDFTSANATNLLYKGTTAAVIGSAATITLQGNATGIEYSAHPLLRQTEDQMVYSSYKLTPVNATTTLTQIAADSEYIKEAMQFLDYGFTVEGSWNYGYGPKGVAYTVNAEGKPEYTDHVLNNPRFENISDTNYTIRYHTGMAFMRPLDQESLPYFFTDPSTAAARLKWAADPNMDNSVVMPTLVLEEDAANERAAIMTDVQTYANEMILKFIVGAEPLKNYDKYLENIRAYGIERAIELTQEAYDIYMSKTR